MKKFVIHVFLFVYHDGAQMIVETRRKAIEALFMGRPWVVLLENHVAIVSGC